MAEPATRTAKRCCLCASRAGEEALYDEELAEDEVALELAPVTAQLAYVAERCAPPPPLPPLPPPRLLWLLPPPSAAGASRVLHWPPAAACRPLHAVLRCAVLRRLGRGEEATSSYERLLQLDLDDATTASGVRPGHWLQLTGRRAEGGGRSWAWMTLNRVRRLPLPAACL